MNRILASAMLLCASFFFAIQSAWAVDITISTVPVGNVANAADTVVMIDDTTGYGSVPYTYRIGTTEVTNAQYAAFLNEKAKSDPLGLYNTNMGSNFGGITRNGAPGSYTYATIAGRDQKPVNFVSWYDSIRFVNWLNNGQAAGDTESGAYTLLGGTPTPSNGDSITRNPGANISLPTENEWYKAAYHKNDGATGHYFAYPTSSDVTPTGEVPPGGSNSANYDFFAQDLTSVGAYTGTTSPYGAFDMGGNVWEWNESLVYSSEFGSFRALHGGSFNENSQLLLSSFRGIDNSTHEEFNIGFRVAVVPEPSTLLLPIFAFGFGLMLRKRFK